VKVGASGSGGDFVTAQMIDNGDAVCAACRAPDGTKCGGGNDKNLCLVSFPTTAVYGNCVVVTQAETTEKSSTSTDGGKGQKNTRNSGQTKPKNRRLRATGPGRTRKG
jgi:hypothetical protein